MPVNDLPLTNGMCWWVVGSRYSLQRPKSIKWRTFPVLPMPMRKFSGFNWKTKRNDRSTDEEQKRVDGRHDGSVNNRVTTEYVKWLDRWAWGQFSYWISVGKNLTNLRAMVLRNPSLRRSSRVLRHRTSSMENPHLSKTPFGSMRFDDTNSLQVPIWENTFSSIRSCGCFAWLRSVFIAQNRCVDRSLAKKTSPKEPEPRRLTMSNRCSSMDERTWSRSTVSLPLIVVIVHGRRRKVAEARFSFDETQEEFYSFCCWIFHTNNNNHRAEKWKNEGMKMNKQTNK